MKQTKLPETLQDYFNIAWRHAVIEKQPPSFVTSDPKITRCMYRGPNGERCLIGAAIPDDRYNPVIEGWGAHDALNRIGMHCPDAVEDGDLYELQRCHDSLRGIHWRYGYHVLVEQNLWQFAVRHALTIPEAA